ncbi:MAG: TetR family transcriptional regulator C-terminal domain-containing protein [Acidimicrobiia bacterium]|nr:TetR family transcriptional regulator C-terminal domain-containing protein [Acidimicrobiia bacterium]
MKRMPPDQRRQAIVDAALSVARRKGFSGTTVRDIASEMGTSSGLIHHYFESMDQLLALAFVQAAEADLEMVGAAMRAAANPPAAIATFLDAYAPADRDWAFQLWFEAWAEATRRPPLRAASRRLNMAWQQLLETTIASGVEAGEFSCDDAGAAAWRILSLLDGLAIQVIAHESMIDRATALAWTTRMAEDELGLGPEPGLQRLVNATTGLR